MNTVRMLVQLAAINVKLMQMGFTRALGGAIGWICVAAVLALPVLGAALGIRAVLAM